MTARSLGTFTKLLLALFLIHLFVSQASLEAQSLAVTPIQCGSIIESQFTVGNTRHRYTIELNPGDVLNVRTERVGDLLNVDIDGFDPLGRRILRILTDGRVQEGSTPVLSSPGEYTLEVIEGSNGTGIYTLYIGCALRDGRVINPGDAMPTEQPITPDSSATPPAPTFSGVGFPGLAPVDFQDAFIVPLSIDTPTQGQIPGAGQGVLGFTFDATAQSMLDLSFTRASGNLNLGLVVLSSENQVVFQASLVTSQTLNTTFSVPTDGTYTIGVFRIDLLPPDAPEPTAFQIAVGLNSAG